MFAATLCRRSPDRTSVGRSTSCMIVWPTAAKIRTLNIVDDFTRECLAFRIAYSFGSADVIREFEDIAFERGFPETVRFDNGSEFTSLAMLRWSAERQFNCTLSHRASRRKTLTSNRSTGRSATSCSICIRLPRSSKPVGLPKPGAPTTTTSDRTQPSICRRPGSSPIDSKSTIPHNYPRPEIALRVTPQRSARHQPMQSHANNTIRTQLASERTSASRMESSSPRTEGTMRAKLALMCAGLIGVALGGTLSPLRSFSVTPDVAEQKISAFHACISPYMKSRYATTLFTLSAAERALDVATAEDACLDLSKIAGLGRLRIACASGYQFTITPENQGFYNATRLALPRGWKGIVYTTPLKMPIALGPSSCPAAK